MASSFIQSSNEFKNSEGSHGQMLNAKILKPLDEVLRCHICFDYFTNCMITKCSHNYCSVCIRRYMTYKSQCPTCFQAATEPELQNNRLIDEILRVYKNIRETLQIPSDFIPKAFCEVPSGSGLNAAEDLVKLSETETHAYIATQKVNSELNETTSHTIASDEVSCPVCYTTVRSDRINIHLDSCLNQSEERNQKKFLPKLVYHLLSDKEIRKKLKEYGLSTSGNRQTLIRRHKNFIILYNANYDSLNPRPVSDLVLEIERQELEEKVHAPQKSQTQVNKKSDPSVIEKEHESYVKKHQSQFNALIHDVQQRELGKKIIKEDDDNTSDFNSIINAPGNIVGDSSSRTGSTFNLETVTVKEELSESLIKNACIDEEIKNDSEKDISKGKKINSDKQIGTSHLPFRIKKEIPSLRSKEDASSFLGMTKNEDFVVDSSQSTLEFEIGKISPCRFNKRKNCKRLSNDDSNHRKK